MAHSGPNADHTFFSIEAKLYEFDGQQWCELGRGNAIVVYRFSLRRACFEFYLKNPSSLVARHEIIQHPKHFVLKPNAGGDECSSWSFVDAEGAFERRFTLRSTTAKDNERFKEAFEFAKEVNSRVSNFEGDELLFTTSGRLYIFESEGWKSIGPGHARLTKCRVSGQSRFVFCRSDDMLCVACHYVDEDDVHCNIKANVSGETCWNWSAIDLSGVGAQVCSYALKLTSPSTANIFRQAFDQARDLTCKAKGFPREVEYFAQRAMCKILKDESWINQGWGDLIILRHKNHGAARLVFKRSDDDRIAANHFIVQSTEFCNLRVSPLCEHCFTWVASDLSDDETCTESFAAKFGNAELAEKFRLEFERAKLKCMEVRPTAKAVSLTVIQSDCSQHVKSSFLLPSGPQKRSIFVGRGPDNDIRLHLTGVSKTHLEISLMDTSKHDALQVCVRDISMNGSMLIHPNGNKIDLRGGSMGCAESGACLVLPLNIKNPPDQDNTNRSQVQLQLVLEESTYASSLASCFGSVNHRLKGDQNATRYQSELALVQSESQCHAHQCVTAPSIAAKAPRQNVPASILDYSSAMLQQSIQPEPPKPEAEASVSNLLANPQARRQVAEPVHARPLPDLVSEVKQLMAHSGRCQRRSCSRSTSREIRMPSQSPSEVKTSQRSVHSQPRRSALRWRPKSSSPVPVQRRRERSRSRRRSPVRQPRLVAAKTGPMGPLVGGYSSHMRRPAVPLPIGSRTTRR